MGAARRSWFSRQRKGKARQGDQGIGKGMVARGEEDEEDEEKHGGLIRKETTVLLQPYGVTAGVTNFFAPCVRFFCRPRVEPVGGG